MEIIDCDTYECISTMNIIKVLVPWFNIETGREEHEERYKCFKCLVKEGVA